MFLKDSSGCWFENIPWGQKQGEPVPKPLQSSRGETVVAQGRVAAEKAMRTGEMSTSCSKLAICDCPSPTSNREGQSWHCLWLLKVSPGPQGHKLYKANCTKAVSHFPMFTSEPTADEGTFWLCHSQRLMCHVVLLFYIKHCNCRRWGKLESLQSTEVIKKPQLSFQWGLEEDHGWLTWNFSFHSFRSWMIAIYQQR